MGGSLKESEKERERLQQELDALAEAASAPTPIVEEDPAPLKLLNKQVADLEAQLGKAHEDAKYWAKLSENMEHEVGGGDAVGGWAVGQAWLLTSVVLCRGAVPRPSV